MNMRNMENGHFADTRDEIIDALYELLDELNEDEEGISQKDFWTGQEYIMAKFVKMRKRNVRQDPAEMKKIEASVKQAAEE